MNAKHLSIGLALAAALSLTGCKPDAAVKHGEVIDKGVTTPASPSQAVTQSAMNTSGPAADVTQFGNITGVVTFTGALQRPVPIDMSMDPACALSGGTNMSEQYVVSNGKLANVYIYIKAGIAPSKAPVNQPPVVLDQKGCKYLPHVIAVQQGGSVEFKNSDPTMHNIHTTPANGSSAGQIDVSQGPMGQPQTREFDAPEVMLPVRCNNHPWMNAFLNVADTPYFAVTGADGKFEIRGIPPGTYTLAAVHEKSGEQDIQITVPAKGTAKTSFSFGTK